MITSGDVGFGVEGADARTLAALETLFGPYGACGGCWCTYRRIEKGERYADTKTKGKLRYRKS